MTEGSLRLQINQINGKHFRSYTVNFINMCGKTQVEIIKARTHRGNFISPGKE